jgi:hypothetical protein
MDVFFMYATGRDLEATTAAKFLMFSKHGLCWYRKAIIDYSVLGCIVLNVY